MIEYLIIKTRYYDTAGGRLAPQKIWHDATAPFLELMRKYHIPYVPYENAGSKLPLLDGFGDKFCGGFSSGKLSALDTAYHFLQRCHHHIPYVPYETTNDSFVIYGYHTEAH